VGRPADREPARFAAVFPLPKYRAFYVPRLARALRAGTARGRFGSDRVAPDYHRGKSLGAATILGARNLFRFNFGYSTAAKSFHQLIQFETRGGLKFALRFPL